MGIIDKIKSFTEKSHENQRRQQEEAYEKYEQQKRVQESGKEELDDEFEKLGKVLKELKRIK